MFNIKKFIINKKLNSLLFIVLTMHMGTYIFLPILPVILKEEFYLNPIKIGTIIGLGALSYQLGSIIGGISSDRIGNKITLVLGAILQVVSLIGYGLSSVYLSFIIFSIINGIGKGIFSPTIKASISLLVQKTNNTRTTAFSLRGIAANIGIILAGLVTLLLAKVYYKFIFFLSALTFLFLTIITLIVIPNDKQRIPKTHFSSYKIIIKNKPFLLFSILSIFIWTIYAQLHLLLPLRASAVLDNAKIVGSIWTITSFTVVIMQNVISKYFLENIKPVVAIVIGTIFMGLAIYLLGYANSFIFLSLCAIIFVFGEMFIIPTIDCITSKIAKKELIGTFFSVSNLIYGIGTALGSFIGGEVIEIYGITNSQTPWFIFVVFALVVALITLLTRNLPLIKKSLNSIE